jgi:signal transduction histidine kinase
MTDAEVETDPRHLRQLLHVLLSNALRHGEGAIFVHVLPDGDGAICQVLNRVRTTPSAASPSNGLGLRLARALAATLGVTLTARPQPDGHYAATIRLRRPTA